MDVDIDDLQTLDIIEKENDILALEKFKKKHCKLFLGFDCSKQFIDYILKNPKWEMSLQAHKYMNIP